MGYSRGIRWTEQMIKDGILEVKEAYELDRMPSEKEIKTYFNNNALACKIGKTKLGYYGYAELLGLKIKDSETYFGKTHEMIIDEKLKAMGYEVIRTTQNYPYDLLVDNAVKIDVKCSRLYRGEQGNFYTFNLENPYATCDIYVFLTLSDDNSIINYYIVPSKFIWNNTQVSIVETKSKYDKYIDKWEYLDQYVRFFDNIS